MLSNHAAELRAAGLEVSDAGFLDRGTPLSHADLTILAQSLLSGSTDAHGDPVSDPANFTCAYLLSIDDTPGLFATLSRQWNAPYATSLGQPMFDNETTIEMLDYLDQMFLSRTLVFPVEWEENYASAPFRRGDVCLSQIESNGLSYSIPSATDGLLTHPFGIFDLDFIPAVQLSEADEAVLSVDLGDEQVIVQAALAAQVKTVNAGIAGASTDLEKIYAWFFLKHLTSTDASAEWAMTHGYLPVRPSGFSSTRPILSAYGLTISFEELVEIGNDFRLNEGVTDWDSEDTRRVLLPAALLASSMVQSQNRFRAIQPLGLVTDFSAAEGAKAKVRSFMEDFYLDEGSLRAALTALSDELSWGF
ncbi:MAG: hypothetical protein Q8N15_06680 [Bacillota bacterium]|nr:hypothetical protein [Bacillota bacterium]